LGIGLCPAFSAARCGTGKTIKMDRVTREIVEDIASITAMRMAAPIEKRLTAIEVQLKMTCRARAAGVNARWKMIGLLLALPGWLAAAIALLRSI
jgi:hypothetical protein